MIAEVLERFGRIDVLVNNAGVFVDGLVEELDGDRWDLCFDINVGGTFRMCRAVIPAMKAQKAGRIINAASFAAIVPSLGSSAYAASKAAVVQFTRTLAGELGPWDITANTYAPGMIPTAMNGFADMSQAQQDRLLDTLTPATLGRGRGGGRLGLLPGQRRCSLHHRHPARRQRRQAGHPAAAACVRVGGTMERNGPPIGAVGDRRRQRDRSGRRCGRGSIRWPGRAERTARRIRSPRPPGSSQRPVAEPLALPLDARDPDAVRRAHAADRRGLAGASAIWCWPRASNTPQRYWGDQSMWEFEAIVDTNLTAVVELIDAVLPGMRARGGGQIVVVSSYSAWRFSPHAGVAYTASKAALAAICASLNAQEAASRIRACHLCPGDVDTDLLEQRPQCSGRSCPHGHVVSGRRRTGRALRTGLTAARARR